MSVSPVIKGCNYKTNQETSQKAKSPVSLPSNILQTSLSLKNRVSKANNYGKKHKNLVRLHSVIGNSQISDVRVPLPHGIDSNTIKTFLSKSITNFLKKWKAIGSLYAAHLSSGGDKATLSSEVFQKLNALQKEIIQAFLKKDASGIFSQKMKEWIEELKLKKLYLMVRSSGDEDLKNAVNAGGNISVSYVTPAEEQVSKAVGEVVASYFSETSLKNRINAGLNPFTTPLNLSVTTQELIGEPIGGAKNLSDIPVSLVLFTHEPTYSDRSFRVMKISAAFGHGEGVVGNEGIVSDTVYAAPSRVNKNSLTINYQNGFKSARLAPIRDRITGKVSLHPVKNGELATARTLDSSIINRLYQLSQLIEKEYGGPMDLEIVIKGGVIYVVQGRPVKRPKFVPTYFHYTPDNQKKGPVLQLVKGETLVLGTGSAMEIRSQREVLVANNLDEAQRAFKNGYHKLVIVAEPELSKNSHPIVNFSSLNVSCFYYPGLKGTHSLLSEMQFSEDKALIACPQSGKLFLWNKKTADPKSYIKRGYLSHPADCRQSLTSKLSIFSHFLNINTSLSNDLKSVIEQLRTAKHQGALELLKKLKRNPLISSLPAQIERLEQHKNCSAVMVRDTLSILKNLQKRLTRVFHELEASLKANCSDLERYYHLKTLSHLFHQEGTHEAGFSLSHVSLYLQEALRAIDYLKEFKNSHLVNYLPISHVALASTMKKKWETFLKGAEKLIESGKLDQEKEKRFHAMIRSLTVLQVLPTWLNIFFAFFQSQYHDPLNLIDQLLKAFPKEEEYCLQELERVRNQIKSQREQLKHLANPSKWEETWRSFRKVASHFEGSRSFLHTSFKNKRLSGIVGIPVMQEFVQLIDEGIKTMKSSKDLSEKQKMQAMKVMLKGNYQSLKAWIYEFVGREKFSFPPPPRLRIRNRSIITNLDQYLSMIEDALNKISLDGSENLRPSRDFSVRAATLESFARTNRHLPETWEDLFTLIHQNQIVVLAKLNQILISENSVVESSFPKVLKEGISAVKKELDGNERYNATQVGLEVTARSVKIYYNISLRNHSTTFQLEYLQGSQGLLLRIQFLGQARRRWPAIMHYINGLNFAKELALVTSPKQTQQEVSFSWDISGEKDLREAFKDYKMMMAVSMGRTEKILERAKERKVVSKVGEWLYLQANELDGKFEEVYEVMGAQHFVGEYLRTDRGKHALSLMAPELREAYNELMNLKISGASVECVGAIKLAKLTEEMIFFITSSNRDVETVKFRLLFDLVDKDFIVESNFEYLELDQSVSFLFKILENDRNYKFRETLEYEADFAVSISSKSPLSKMIREIYAIQNVFEQHSFESSGPDNILRKLSKKLPYWPQLLEKQKKIATQAGEKLFQKGKGTDKLGLENIAAYFRSKKGLQLAKRISEKRKNNEKLTVNESAYPFTRYCYLHPDSKLRRKNYYEQFINFDEIFRSQNFFDQLVEEGLLDDLVDFLLLEHTMDFVQKYCFPILLISCYLIKKNYAKEKMKKLFKLFSAYKGENEGRIRGFSETLEWLWKSYSFQPQALQTMVNCWSEETFSPGL